MIKHQRCIAETLEPRVFLSVARPAYNTGTGFFVSGGKVYDANGNEFVMKGVNAVHAWGSYNTNYNTIDQIARTGANAVRTVMYQDIVADPTNNWTDSADTPARRKTVVERYIANGITVIAEDHASIQDSNSQSSKTALDEITQHWINNQSWLKQYEKYVILNIANEWGQPALNAEPHNHSWRDAYIDEVTKLRNGADLAPGTGDDITNLIMIDAGQWGQDYNTLKYDAQAIEDADPQHNVVFSIHIYSQWRDESRAFEEMPSNNFGPWDISNGLTQLKSANLPLVVGEFAWENFRDFNSGGPYASYRTGKLLQTLDSLDIGWMGWSYNGSTPQSLNFLTNLNNTTYNSNSDLSEWGNALVNDPLYGLKASAVRASVYSDPLPAIPNPPSPLPALPSSMLSDDWFILNRTLVGIPEGGQGIVQLRLSRQPASDVVVTLAKSSGDADLNLSTTSLLFTPGNWNQYQSILLSGNADADTTVGSAKFTLSSGGMTTTDFTAKEIEPPALPTGNTFTIYPDRDRLYNGSGMTTPVTVFASNEATYYMRFPLSSLRGKITAAHLLVFTTNTTANRRVRLYAALDEGWTEMAGNTASNSNPINAAYPLYPGTDNTGFLLPMIGPGSFLDIGINELANFVSSEYLKDGVVTLALRMVSNSAAFSTRENGTNPPQLIVTTADATPPQVLASSFDYQTNPQKLSFTFSEDVSASLTSADVVVTSVSDPGLSISLGSPTYNAGTNTATFALNPAILPDGNYRATLLGAGVSDVAANPMLSNNTLDFFFLAGDPNHDGAVDVSDLGILATNWQRTGMSFAQGDFNYDGNVDVTDLGILATNWQETLPGSSLVGGIGKLVPPTVGTSPKSASDTLVKKLVDDLPDLTTEPTLS